MDTATWPIPVLVDHVLATYVEWRETTDAIADAGRWCGAPAGEEAPHSAAHLAALDQEEIAAATHAGSIGQLERRLPDPDAARGSAPALAG